MSIQKNIKLQVQHSKEGAPLRFAASLPAKDCEINIQVADGWAITGHYRNQTLQTITLQKFITTEE